MATAYLRRAIPIVQDAGWTFSFNFYTASPGAFRTADPLDGFAAELTLLQANTPGATPVVLSTAAGSIVIVGNAVTLLQARTATAALAPGDYDGELRVWDPAGSIDRWVVLSNPAESRYKVIALGQGGPAGAGSADVVASANGADVVSGGDGPRGQAAGQDLGWSLSGVLATGEVINAPPLAHETTFAQVYIHTDSGVLAPQVFTLRQVSAGVTIATATFILAPGVHDLAAAAPFAGLVGDIFKLVGPSPADSQLTDLAVTLGSTP